MYVHSIDFEHDHIVFNYNCPRKCSIVESWQSMWETGMRADRQLVLAWLSKVLHMELQLAILDEAGPAIFDMKFDEGDVVTQANRDYLIVSDLGRFDANSYSYIIQEICKSWK